jgi:hypothetical protein
MRVFLSRVNLLAHGYEAIVKLELGQLEGVELQSSGHYDSSF